MDNRKKQVPPAPPGPPVDVINRSSGKIVASVPSSQLRQTIGALKAPAARETLAPSAAFDPKVHPQVARALARAGTSDDDTASVLGITTATLDEWRASQPAFAQAMREGRQFADARVEDTLYRRATGYDYEESEVEQGPDGTIKKVKRRHVPGDVDACIFWLRAHGPRPPVKR